MPFVFSIAGICKVIKSDLEKSSSIEPTGSTSLGNFQAASTESAGS